MNHDKASGQTQEHRESGHGHRWLMIACCIPMVAIAVALVVTGVGIGFIVVALLCTVMMAMMMRGMGH